MALPKTQLLEFHCHDTTRNLPRKSDAIQEETRFLTAFELAFFGQQERYSTETEYLAAGREFALEGYGRADLLFIRANPVSPSHPTETLTKTISLTLTAIETKLKDWRQGLVQASRYRYFAHQSLLVLPPRAASIARNFIQTFHDLHIGLWEFNPEQHLIIEHYSPELKPPFSLKAHQKALSKLHPLLKPSSPPQK